MDLELEIRAESYKKDVLQMPTPRGHLVVPVQLYRLRMKIPFEFSGTVHPRGGQLFFRIDDITFYAYGRLCYKGPLTGHEGIDPDFLLALGCAVPQKLLKKPHTFFQQFQRPVNGNLYTNLDTLTGVFVLDRIAAYSTPHFERRGYSISSSSKFPQ